MGNSKLAGYLVGALLAVPGPAQDLEIQVNVFNYAGVPEKRLTAAKETAGRVLASAGLATNWVDFPVTLKEMKACERCQSMPKATDLTVKLLPDSMVRSWPNDRRHLAYSILERGRFGNLAGVYLDRVARVASRERASLELVLGHVMAHEIGHLLLGPDSHSRRGVMRFPVNRDYLRLAAKRQLRFAPSQVREIRQQIDARRATIARVH
ncbi:MAG: hypothetical protein GY953_50120 [bacterium]|nr:hypothetical protein [bacterium]